MPMNTAGFDCRAPRIMGDWMVGLPSVRKLVQLATLVGGTAPSEDLLPTGVPPAVLGSLKTGYDDNPQPYVEVPPDSTLYAQALQDARARMVEYHEGVRYQYCQDVLSPDIYDPFVPFVHPEYTYHPNPYEYQTSADPETPPLDPMHPDRYVQPRIGVPYHAHWINYDPTEPPPPWVPRRTDWKEILVGGMTDTGVPIGMKSPEQLEADGNPADADAFRHRRTYVARALAESALSDELRSYATKEKPFGTWVTKPACMQKLAASQQTVSQLPASETPAWLAVARPDPGAYLYKLSPGAAIFRHVCINCHGPNADGKGIQVDLLAAASEGEARPANFKGGLFGPLETPLSNILATFDVANTGDKKAADTWASRYMAWMALGGTLKRIPQDVLHLVTTTPILGHPRVNIGQLPGASDPTGNMLNMAKGLCSMVLPTPTSDGLPDYEKNVYAYNNNSLLPPPSNYPPYSYQNSPFVDSTYDKEMWLHLCGDFSPQVVRVYGTLSAPTNKGDLAVIQLVKMYYAVHPDPVRAANAADTANYPADAPVWDHTSYATKTQQMGVTRRNLYPACLDPKLIPADQLTAGHAAKQLPPGCPPDFLRDAQPLWINEREKPSAEDQLVFAGNIQVWVLRGATASGMSVFSYLEQRMSDPNMAKLSPYYDQCELLP
jgi:hypothetical protein